MVLFNAIIQIFFFGKNITRSFRIRLLTNKEKNSMIMIRRVEWEMEKRPITSLQKPLTAKFQIEDHYNFLYGLIKWLAEILSHNCIPVSKSSQFPVLYSFASTRKDQQNIATDQVSQVTKASHMYYTPSIYSL